MDELSSILIDSALLRDVINGGALAMMFVIVVLVVWVHRPYRRNEVSINLSSNGDDEVAADDDEQ